MAFAHFGEKDDMQDDTYKIIGTLLADAIVSWQQKDIERYYSDVDSLYCLIWSRLDDATADEFELKLKKAGSTIYSSNPDVDEEVRLSNMTATFDDLRMIFKQLTKRLDQIGILFKFKVNADEIIANKGGMT